MSKFTFTSPDGQSYDIEGPEGATPEQAFGMLQQHLGTPAAPQQTGMGGAPIHVDRLEGMGFGDKFAAGAGRGVTNIGRGIAQLPLPSDLTSAFATGKTPRLDAFAAQNADQQQLDAPLMETGAGKAGNIAGTAAVLAPTALIPGANTVAGSAIVGGATGFLGTPGTVEERTQAAKYGLAGGPLGIAAGRLGGTGLEALGQRAALAGREAAVTNQTIREAVGAGYRLPVSEMAQSGPGRFAARTAESFGGKASTGQLALRTNQTVTNGLVREDLGLAGRGQISRAELDRVMAPHLRVYQEAARTSPAAADALRAWRGANDLARRYTREFNTNNTVAAEDAAIAARAQAAQHLAQVEQEAAAAGNAGLAQRLSQARIALGRIGTVENALNEDTGNVSATALARALDNNVPLTGGMERAARFARAFPEYSRTPKGMPGVSKLDATALVSGLAAAPVTGGASLAVAALPVVSYATRNVLLSRPVQRMVVPGMAQGATRQAVGAALRGRASQNVLSRLGTAYGTQE